MLFGDGLFGIDMLGGGSIDSVELSWTEECDEETLWTEIADRNLAIVRCEDGA